jgi:hypothetical protein
MQMGLGLGVVGLNGGEEARHLLIAFWGQGEGRGGGVNHFLLRVLFCASCGGICPCSACTGVFCA